VLPVPPGCPQGQGAVGGCSVTWSPGSLETAAP
jgi:hypothetical protein